MIKKQVSRNIDHKHHETMAKHQGALFKKKNMFLCSYV